MGTWLRRHQRSHHRHGVARDVLDEDAACGRHLELSRPPAGGQECSGQLEEWNCPTMSFGMRALPGWRPRERDFLLAGSAEGSLREETSAKCEVAAQSIGVTSQAMACDQLLAKDMLRLKGTLKHARLLWPRSGGTCTILPRSSRCWLRGHCVDV